MPMPTWGEIYFVAGMMLLTLIITVVSIYFFIKTYKKEMREKEERRVKKEREKTQSGETAEGGDDAA